MFSPELRTKAEELVGRYPAPRSALLPLLHLVQAQDGWVTEEGLAECAELLGLTKAEVQAVATFYTMYKREPMGRHLVSVCTNFSCKVRGAAEVYARLSEKLGVGHNGTNQEAGITLEHAECLGNCEGAPVMTIDYLNYECVTPEAAVEIVDAAIAGQPPPPTRGMVPPGVRDVSFRLAGLGGRDEDRTGPAMARARATDGGLVPARTAESGPGASVVAFEPTFSEGQAERREAAKAAVRAAGQDPELVEAEAGGRAREFPTRDPDAEAPEPGTAPQAEPGADAPEDPRGKRETPEAAHADAEADQRTTGRGQKKPEREPTGRASDRPHGDGPDGNGPDGNDPDGNDDGKGQADG